MTTSTYLFALIAVVAFIGLLCNVLSDRREQRKTRFTER